MDWKQFFKPTIAKLALTIIIFAVFVPVFEYRIRCQIPPCGVATRSIITHVIKDINIEGINYVNIIIGLIVSYLISCATLFGIQKVIKKPTSTRKS